MDDSKGPSLEEVLEAYDIHFGKSCKGCIYEVKGEFDGSCITRMEKDLHKYLMLLRKENRELIDKMYRMEQSM